MLCLYFSTTPTCCGSPSAPTLHTRAASYRDKRHALEDQQRHLNTGLAKIQDTEESVASLRSSLGSQQALLTEKTKEADAKVAQMVQEQNDAERKKQECEALSKELAAQNEVRANACLRASVSHWR